MTLMFILRTFPLFFTAITFHRYPFTHPSLSKQSSGSNLDSQHFFQPFLKAKRGIIPFLFSPLLSLPLPPPPFPPLGVMFQWKYTSEQRSRLEGVRTTASAADFEPNVYSRMIAKRPGLCVATVLGVCVALSACLAAVAGEIEVDTELRGFNNPDHYTNRREAGRKGAVEHRYDADKDLRQVPFSRDSTVLSEAQQFHLVEPDSVVTLLYIADGTNVLTPAILEAIFEFERQIFAAPAYQEGGWRDDITKRHVPPGVPTQINSVGQLFTMSYYRAEEALKVAGEWRCCASRGRDCPWAWHLNDTEQGEMVLENEGDPAFVLSCPVCLEDGEEMHDAMLCPLVPLVDHSMQEFMLRAGKNVVRSSANRFMKGDAIAFDGASRGYDTKLSATQVETTLRFASRRAADPEKNKWFFGKDFNEETLSSRFLRSEVVFGRRTLEHASSTKSLILQLNDEILGSFSVPGVRLVAGNDYLIESQVWDSIRSDALLALLSFFIMFVYLALYFKSVFMAVACLVQIAITFPVSLFLYVVVLRQTALGALNVLSLYIVIGIGVDDVFVFSNAFFYCEKHEVEEKGAKEDEEMTKKVEDDNATYSSEVAGSIQKERNTPHRRDSIRLEERVAYAIRKAGIPILVTSSTSGIAFLSTCISSIPAIRGFGLLMWLLVMMNLILVVTLFPAVLVLYVQYNERKEASKAGPKATLVDLVESAEEEEEGEEGVVEGCQRGFGHVVVGWEFYRFIDSEGESVLHCPVYEKAGFGSKIVGFLKAGCHIQLTRPVRSNLCQGFARYEGPDLSGYISLTERHTTVVSLQYDTPVFEVVGFEESKEEVMLGGDTTAYFNDFRFTEFTEDDSNIAVPSNFTFFASLPHSREVLVWEDALHCSPAPLFIEVLAATNDLTISSVLQQPRRLAYLRERDTTDPSCTYTHRLRNWGSNGCPIFSEASFGSTIVGYLHNGDRVDCARCSAKEIFPFLCVGSGRYVATTSMCFSDMQMGEKIAENSALEDIQWGRFCAEGCNPIGVFEVLLNETWCAGDGGGATVEYSMPSASSKVVAVHSTNTIVLCVKRHFQMGVSGTVTSPLTSPLAASTLGNVTQNATNFLRTVHGGYIEDVEERSWGVPVEGRSEMVATMTFCSLDEFHKKKAAKQLKKANWRRGGEEEEEEEGVRNNNNTAPASPLVKHITLCGVDLCGIALYRTEDFLETVTTLADYCDVNLTRSKSGAFHSRKLGGYINPAEVLVVQRKRKRRVKRGRMLGDVTSASEDTADDSAVEQMGYSMPIHLTKIFRVEPGETPLYFTDASVVQKYREGSLTEKECIEQSSVVTEVEYVTVLDVHVDTHLRVRSASQLSFVQLAHERCLCLGSGLAQHSFMARVRSVVLPRFKVDFGSVQCGEKLALLSTTDVVNSVVSGTLCDGEVVSLPPHGSTFPFLSTTDDATQLKHGFLYVSEVGDAGYQIRRAESSIGKVVASGSVDGALVSLGGEVWGSRADDSDSVDVVLLTGVAESLLGESEVLSGEELRRKVVHRVQHAEPVVRCASARSLTSILIADNETEDTLSSVCSDEFFYLPGHREPLLRRVFDVYVYPALYRARFMLLVGFALIVVGSVVVASRLSPQEEPPSFFDDDHDINIFRSKETLFAKGGRCANARSGGCAAVFNEKDAARLVGCSGVAFSSDLWTASCYGCDGVLGSNVTENSCGMCGFPDDLCSQVLLLDLSLCGSVNASEPSNFTESLKQSLIRDMIVILGDSVPTVDVSLSVGEAGCAGGEAREAEVLGRGGLLLHAVFAVQKSGVVLSEAIAVEGVGFQETAGYVAGVGFEVVGWNATAVLHVTEAPDTAVPATEAPRTFAPRTDVPDTQVPTSVPTVAPPTAVPTSVAPPTPLPTRVPPTPEPTGAPPTPSPDTAVPTSVPTAAPPFFTATATLSVTLPTQSRTVSLTRHSETESVSVSPSRTLSASGTWTASVSRSATVSVSPSVSGTHSATGTVTTSVSGTATQSGSATETDSETLTATTTATGTRTLSRTLSTTASATATQTASLSWTSLRTASLSASLTHSRTPVATRTLTTVETRTVSRTVAVVAAAREGRVLEVTAVPTAVPTAAPTAPPTLSPPTLTPAVAPTTPAPPTPSPQTLSPTPSPATPAPPTPSPPTPAPPTLAPTPSPPTSVPTPSPPTSTPPTQSPPTPAPPTPPPTPSPPTPAPPTPSPPTPSPPTAVPTPSPPTPAPPTLAPPTPSPPTPSPPTPAPPTPAPPTSAPPTPSPPTPAPPTPSPPTPAPPTPAPPTPSPPTPSPPTPAPPTPAPPTPAPPTPSPPTPSPPTPAPPTPSPPTPSPPTPAPPTPSPPTPAPPTAVPTPAPPTAVPTPAPPTSAPPTLPPQTPAPPTRAPPTPAPPTAPPTPAPPTVSPPTDAPRTRAPPTQMPTSAPATHAPDTAAPPTPAPPTAEPTMAPPARAWDVVLRVDAVCAEYQALSAALQSEVSAAVARHLQERVDGALVLVSGVTCGSLVFSMVYSGGALDDTTIQRALDRTDLANDTTITRHLSGTLDVLNRRVSQGCPGYLTGGDCRACSPLCTDKGGKCNEWGECTACSGVVSRNLYDRIDSFVDHCGTCGYAYFTTWSRTNFTCHGDK